MNEQILENGRRKIARECRDKLKQLKKLSDKQSTEILKGYLPKFQLTPLSKMPCKYVAELLRTHDR